MSKSQSYLNYARQIGDEILSASDGQINWSLVGATAQESNISLYSGSVGLLLFYASLYQQCREQKYLKVVQEGVAWIKEIGLTTEPTNCSFYSGHLGMVYVMTELSRLLEEEEYQMLALAIAKKCSDQSYHKDKHVNDLLGGIAGMILCLVHLHALTKEDWLLRDIEMLSQDLICRSKLSQSGLFWDLGPKHQNGLCGWAHGSSGIGFVFLELGHYFQNEDLYWLADQAFAHEAAFYVDTANNWMDLRSTDDDLALFREVYKRNEAIDFPVRTHITAWCHGAPGIGLARLRAWELSGDERYEEALNRTLHKTEESMATLDSSCLCHGLAGNAVLFLEAGRRRKEEAYLLRAKEIGQQLIAGEADGQYTTILDERYAHYYAEDSLFLGKLGLAYFMLHLAQPANFRSVLFPTIEQHCETKSLLSSLSVDAIFESLCKSYYPKTIQLLNKQQIPLPKLSPENNPCQLLNGLFEKQVKFANHPAISEIYQLERTKQNWQTDLDNNTWLYIKALCEKEKNEVLLKENIWKVPFVLSEEVQLFETQWNWTGNGWRSNVSQEAEQFFLVLKRQAADVFEFKVSPFSFIVLSAFQKAGSLDEKYELILDQLKVYDIADYDSIKPLLVKQIRNAMREGLLIGTSGNYSNV